MVGPRREQHVETVQFRLPGDEAQRQGRSAAAIREAS